MKRLTALSNNIENVDLPKGIRTSKTIQTRRVVTSTVFQNEEFKFSSVLLIENGDLHSVPCILINTGIKIPDTEFLVVRKI